MLSPYLADLLALHLTPGLGPQRIAALLEHFGSPSSVRRSPSVSWQQVRGFGGQLASSLHAALSSVDVQAEIDRIEKLGASLLARGQPEYPSSLSEIPGSPSLLYVHGSISPPDSRAVALVGTRHPTSSGKRIAKQLADGLARAGVCVVSGLARGIDGIAHRGALDAGGRTIAVLAGGLQRLYPPEHKGLAQEITQRGAVVTESTMDQEPLKGLFPARNRIISGLSRIIVIVQAPADSGALITAEHAAEQGRTVMAVPGVIDEPDHAGCHRLIREGAVLCRGVEDILEELDGFSASKVGHSESQTSAPTAATVPIGPPPSLSDVEQQIWNLLEKGPTPADLLAQEAGMAVPQLSTVLLKLEMKKIIRRLPGNQFERM